MTHDLRRFMNAVRLCEATAKLADLYDEYELNDQREMLANYVDPEDLDRDFVVHIMSPAQAKTYVTARDDMTVVDAFKQFASREQKRLVRDKAKRYDADRIIVVFNRSVIDGNHQLMAGIMANRPIKYIDLSE